MRTVCGILGAILGLAGSANSQQTIIHNYQCPFNNSSGVSAPNRPANHWYQFNCDNRNDPNGEGKCRREFCEHMYAYHRVVSPGCPAGRSTSSGVAPTYSPAVQAVGILVMLGAGGGAALGAAIEGGKTDGEKIADQQAGRQPATLQYGIIGAGLGFATGMVWTSIQKRQNLINAPWWRRARVLGHRDLRGTTRIGVSW